MINIFHRWVFTPTNNYCNFCALCKQLKHCATTKQQSPRLETFSKRGKQRSKPDMQRMMKAMRKLIDWLKRVFNPTSPEMYIVGTLNGKRHKIKVTTDWYRNEKARLVVQDD